MNQTTANMRKHAADDPRERSESPELTEAQPRERLPIINRFCPDWFALRSWEDDGGG